MWYCSQSTSVPRQRLSDWCICLWACSMHLSKVCRVLGPGCPYQVAGPAQSRLAEFPEFCRWSGNFDATFWVISDNVRRGEKPGMSSVRVPNCRKTVHCCGLWAILSNLVYLAVLTMTCCPEIKFIKFPNTPLVPPEGLPIWDIQHYKKRTYL